MQTFRALYSNTHHEWPEGVGEHSRFWVPAMRKLNTSSPRFAARRRSATMGRGALANPWTRIRNASLGDRSRDQSHSTGVEKWHGLCEDN